MRKHKVIRQEEVAPATTFLFDIETEQFENIMVTWDNTGGAAAPTTLILAPTVNRRADATANFPGLPAAPAAGNVAYSAIGPNMILAFPIPAMLTVGVVNSATSAVTLRVEGDEIGAPLQDPNPKQRNRS